MTVITSTEERHVVPRWRQFHAAIDVGELSTQKGTVPDAVFQELDRRRREWQSAPSIMTASDLVHTAAIAGTFVPVADAIRFILESPNVPELVRQSTKLSDDGYVDVHLADVDVRESVKIAYLKRVLEKWPRNAIAWTELALLYCQLGVEAKAKRCIRIATNLAPSNRYVLRSAARFFVHVGDAEQGRDLLRNTRRTKHDPWLLAAEISTSQVMGRTSTLLKNGLDLLDQRKFMPSNTTELAASLGMQELESGSKRKAKALFRRGARSANDNVRAQLRWVELNHSDALPKIEMRFEDEIDGEAKALGFQRMEDWSNTVESAKVWANSERFSERPFIFGSYISIEALGDAAMAVEFLEKGMKANPNDRVLLNNLSVALAILGETEESAKKLKLAKRRSSGSPDDGIMLTATEGLLEYRRENIPEGRRLYLDAMELAKTHKKPDMGIRAAIYMAIEELDAKTDDSGKLAKMVLNSTRQSFLPKVKPLVKRLENKRKGVSIGSASKIHRSVDELIQKLR